MGKTYRKTEKGTKILEGPGGKYKQENNPSKYNKVLRRNLISTKQKIYIAELHKDNPKLLNFIDYLRNNNISIKEIYTGLTSKVKDSFIGIKTYKYKIEVPIKELKDIVDIDNKWLFIDGTEDSKYWYISDKYFTVDYIKDYEFYHEDEPDIDYINYRDKYYEKDIARNKREKERANLELNLKDHYDRYIEYDTNEWYMD